MRREISPGMRFLSLVGRVIEVATITIMTTSGDIQCVLRVNRFINVVYQMKYEMIRDRHSFCLVISSLFVTYPTDFPAGIVKPRRISAATYPSKFRALVASR